MRVFDIKKNLIQFFCTMFCSPGRFFGRSTSERVGSEKLELTTNSILVYFLGLNTWFWTPVKNYKNDATSVLCMPYGDFSNLIEDAVLNKPV